MNKVFSYRDADTAYVMPDRDSNAQDTDLWHLGTVDGIHYFSYNPSMITLADNPDHDQREYTTTQEKSSLQAILPRLGYLQQKLNEMRIGFLAQHDQFSILVKLANGDANFISALNSKDAEINTLLENLGF